MPTQQAAGRLVPILWFVAAALALVATVIPALGGGRPNWAVMAGGLFCFVMGIAAWRAKKQPPPAT